MLCKNLNINKASLDISQYCQYDTKNSVNLTIDFIIPTQKTILNKL